MPRLFYFYDTNADTNAFGMRELTDQELFRRQEVETLRAMGVTPYPSETFEVTTLAADIKAHYTAGTDAKGTAFESVRLAGRVMRKRIMGKAAFIELQDSSGAIQLYINRDHICPEEDKAFYNEVFKKLVSLGDFIGAEGYVFTTQTGEISVHVRSFKILSKALRPLPLPKEKDGVLHDAFTDPEQRYRMRYVDLAVNPHVKETFIKRSKMIRAMRDFLHARGYLEVETPILQPVHGGALARPFVTHHNTLDMKLYLRIANELYLKRLIVGGFDGVFEFAKDFRNEGMSRFHNPEFTQVELYVAYKDYLWMADLVEEMVEAAAREVNGAPEVRVGEHTISFARPWARYTFFGAIEKFSGIDARNLDAKALYQAARNAGVFMEPTEDKALILDEIFGEKVEPNLIQPTFILDYPVEASPLAKRRADDPALTERFEVVCNGKEICNAYSELNDPLDQRKRFEEQLLSRDAGNEDAMVLDEDFLRALEYGMPPTAGLGVGLDRLAMILTAAPSIQDVLFFPQMRPEKASETENRPAE